MAEAAVEVVAAVEVAEAAEVVVLLTTGFLCPRQACRRSPRHPVPRLPLSPTCRRSLLCPRRCHLPLPRLQPPPRRRPTGFLSPPCPVTLGLGLGLPSWVFPVCPVKSRRQLPPPHRLRAFLRTQRQRLHRRLHLHLLPHLLLLHLLLHLHLHRMPQTHTRPVLARQRTTQLPTLQLTMDDPPAVREREQGREPPSVEPRAGASTTRPQPCPPMSGMPGRKPSTPFSSWRCVARWWPWASGLWASGLWASGLWASDRVHTHTHTHLHVPTCVPWMVCWQVC